MLACAAALGFILAGSTAALADGHTGYPEADDGFAPQRSVALGGAVIVQPKFEGSDEYRVTGIPLIRPQLGGGSGLGAAFRRFVDIRGLDEVRLQVLQHGLLKAGPVVGYQFGRDEDDADQLIGLGDVDGSFVAGAFVSLGTDALRVDAVYQHTTAGDIDGYRLTIGAETRQDLTPGSYVKARVGVTYADENYQTTYFGITDTQAAASTAGLTAYEASAGIKDVHAELGGSFALTERWSVLPQVRYSRLVGDAADSPIVENENQFSGRLGLTYRIDLD
ncbi:MAG: MipA/OmpV family protein [Pseudomonadota bacterium]